MTTKPNQEVPEVSVQRERADALQGELDRRVGAEEALSDALVAQTRKGDQSEALFRLLIDSVLDYAIFMLDPSGRVATWNAGAQRLKGYEAHEIIGRHFSAFVPEAEVRAGKCEHELEVAQRVGRFEDEGWRIRKDGTQFWANVVITAMRDDGGRVLGFAKITRDLTDRKRTEEERAARHAAEQANRAKDEFLAMLSHELRNPLAPISTALQLIKLRGDSSSREYQVIERQMQHVMRLVDDLFDVSRITRGKIELNRRSIDVREVIAQAIEIAGPMFEQRRQHLDVVAPHQPVMVDGDEARLTQVFTNLLTNAAKYTQQGGHVTVTVQRLINEVMIAVRDDGTGIDAALLPRVFDLFVQGPQTGEPATGGLGLGLTLVNSLVQLHRGRIEAHSEGLGRGSTFTVHLPALHTPAAGVSVPTLPADSPPTTGSAMAAGSRRILIVDDNDDARSLLSDILERSGHDVRAVGDAHDALALVEEFAPDVAILDIGLPVMDGYELAARMRATMKTATPRLISLTGYGQKADHDRSRAAGFDHHLVKPVNMRRLLETIQDCATDA